MIAGDRVRLKVDTPLAGQHPELAGAIGVVGSALREDGRALLHVRFGMPANVVVLNADAGQFEAVDHLDPRLPGR